MKLTIKEIQNRKKNGEKITVLTAYDYPFAKIIDESGADIILVGDSLGMVVLGYESTVPVTMRDMIHHSRAVSKAVKHAVLVGDMPFGSYDTPERALRNAKRFLQSAGCDAVKLEGGTRIQKQVEALVGAGIPVMGHLGLTPQTASSQGGYKVQGQDPAQAREMRQEAKLLDQLGVFSLVLECVPKDLAGQITQDVTCPTIGIGAGPGTDGQVLVLHDMLGFSGSVQPRFVRRYADLDGEVRKAVETFGKDVRAGKYPSLKESF